MNNRRTWLLPLWAVLLNQTVYYGGNALARGLPHWNLELWVDSLIPVLPWTVSVYLGCFVFWAVFYVLLARGEPQLACRFYLADTLAKNHIKIRAHTLADTAEFGILRLIVDKPEKGREVLANEGIVVRLTNVLALSAQDAPGGALGALRVLAESGINVEYMYAYVAKVSGKAIMIVQVEDMEVAEEILRRHGFDEADFAGFGD